MDAEITEMRVSSHSNNSFYSTFNCLESLYIYERLKLNGRNNMLMQYYANNFVSSKT